MNKNVLKGTIYVTDNMDFVTSVPDQSVKIISLDEDNRLNPNDPNVVIGTCLLPPIEALIAEADGDEDLYNIHYINHLNSPYVQEFIGVLISALYRGISLLLFAPQMKENISIVKLRQHLWSLYGITIGIVGGESCSFDPRCIPIWLNMVYSANVISPYEFLIEYPENVIFNNMIMNKLISEIKPVGNSYEDRVEFIKAFHSKLKNKPQTKSAIYDIRFN